MELTIHMKIKLHTTNNKQKKKKNSNSLCSNSNFFSSVDEMFISGIFKHMKNRGNLFHYRDTYRLKKIAIYQFTDKIAHHAYLYFKNIRSQPFTTYSICFHELSEYFKEGKRLFHCRGLSCIADG